ncbi:hypothetical protein GCM10022251_25310 [Phytohabitans flavus]|uniref:Type VII secretion system protein EccE domain-containing protein n=1 Tax=Phytohabitans flavus TaxID=1076124 RepID=A0A6F8XR01_9ACTN|nr:type VII secretion protein EccE [Phytohabitans flavus]BCB76265.1 hypothetical protein Pflav_026750 [Phytohabitans flavus]
MAVSTAVARPAGRVGATQVVAVEVAIALAAAAYAFPPVAAGVTGAVGVVVLFGAVLRFQGRWGYEVAAARWRLWRRRGAARAAAPRDALAVLAPELSLATATDRSGAVGVGADALGWFAAVAVVPHDGLARGSGTELRLDRLARLATDAAFPAALLQVVTRRVPFAGDPRSAYARSYVELRQALGVPAPLDVWIAVRLGVRDGAAAAADRGGGAAGVHRALAAAVSRLGSELAGMGLAHRVLDAAGLRDALGVACGQGPRPPGESWSRWQASPDSHISFAVRSWPARGADGLLARLAEVPDAAAVHTAVLLGAGRGGVAAQAVVRLVAAPDRMAACVRHLRTSAAGLGIRLIRLNGEHAAGVYATAPTGATTGLVPW